MSLSTIILIALAVVVAYVMFRATRAGRDQAHARGVDGAARDPDPDDPAASARPHSGHGHGEEGRRHGHGRC